MTGQLFINNQDAYTTWGITMTGEALTALMTPPPLKEWITNEARDESGKQYLTGSGYTPAANERTLTLTINLTARSEVQFLTRYAAFCAVLASGVLHIRTSFQEGVVYKCVYKSCSQFTQFRRSMATLGLSLVEPDPTDRS